MSLAHATALRVHLRPHGRSAQLVSRGSVVGASLFLGLVLFSAPVKGIAPSLCKDDGVTEIPPFAVGRDANSCLLIDPGNGDSPIPFQYEFFHLNGTAGGEKSLLLSFSEFGECRTKDQGEYCSQIIWDTRIDNYLHPDRKNQDGWEIGGRARQYLLVKDSFVGNTWRCRGGGWSGPHGIGCSAGEASSKHTDALQIKNQPVAGGWVVFQDTFVGNGEFTMIVQQSPEFPPAGSYVFQGFRVGRLQDAFGSAATWISDCKARTPNDPASCEGGGRVHFDYPAPEIWLIDVSGNAKFTVGGPTQKLVIVNSGCGTSGCTGKIEFFNGWPHPLRESNGPGSCPNGLILQNPNFGGYAMAAFCYTSLEEALNDVATTSAQQGDCPAPYCPHEPPPFIRLSPSGWKNPPGASAPGPPPPPTLLQ